MRRILTAAAVLLVAMPGTAAERCEYQQIPVGERKLGAWIDASNWLATDTQRLTLPLATTFMPAIRMSVVNTAPLRPTPNVRQLDLDRLPTTDPADGSRRDLGFLFASRLGADAVVVLHNGRRIAEHYWHGTPAEAPRALLSGSRPVLSLLGGIAIQKGRLAGDKAVTRPLATIADNAALRKLSVRRLLEGNDAYAWGAEDSAGWMQAAGWGSVRGPGTRVWLARQDGWGTLAPAHDLPPAQGRPEDDLLAWLIAESMATPVSQLFCESLLASMHPEHPALWLTDPAGHELAAGLALSPRDHARLGQLVLDARASGKRGRLPDWLIEALAAPAGSRPVPELAGLPAGSELRYGFVRLGGKGSRIALLGPGGTSLLIDFDRRLVIALHASHAGTNSPLLRATLDETWRAIAAALPANRR
jgi:hypothetical protein